MAAEVRLSAAVRKLYGCPDVLVLDRIALDRTPGSVIAEWEDQLPTRPDGLPWSISAVLLTHWPAMTSFGKRVVAWIAWNLTAPDSAPKYVDFDPPTTDMKWKLAKGIDAGPPELTPSAALPEGGDNSETPTP